MKPKYYFTILEEEYCYTLKQIKEKMKEDGMKSLVIYPAKIMINSGYFFCTFYGECGEVGDGCGRECSEYKPRNDKNGRCKYSNNCYEPLYENQTTITI